MAHIGIAPPRMGGVAIRTVQCYGLLVLSVPITNQKEVRSPDTNSQSISERLEEKMPQIGKFWEARKLDTTLTTHGPWRTIVLLVQRTRNQSLVFSALA
jgi:hypothetical protein